MNILNLDMDMLNLNNYSDIDINNDEETKSEDLSSNDMDNYKEDCKDIFLSSILFFKSLITLHDITHAMMSVEIFKKLDILPETYKNKYETYMSIKEKLTDIQSYKNSLETNINNCKDLLISLLKEYKQLSTNTDNIDILDLNEKKQYLIISYKEMFQKNFNTLLANNYRKYIETICEFVKYFSTVMGDINTIVNKQKTKLNICLNMFNINVSDDSKAMKIYEDIELIIRNYSEISINILFLIEMEAERIRTLDTLNCDMMDKKIINGDIDNLITKYNSFDINNLPTNKS